MMNQLGQERLGSVLRRMAEDLVTERRRVVLLKRENRELRMQLEAFQRSVEYEQQRPVEANH